MRRCATLLLAVSAVIGCKARTDENDLSAINSPVIDQGLVDYSYDWVGGFDTAKNEFVVTRELTYCFDRSVNKLLVDAFNEAAKIIPEITKFMESGVELITVEPWKLKQESFGNTQFCDPNWSILANSFAPKRFTNIRITQTNLKNYFTNFPVDPSSEAVYRIDRQTPPDEAVRGAPENDSKFMPFAEDDPRSGLFPRNPEAALTELARFKNMERPFNQNEATQRFVMVGEIDVSPFVNDKLAPSSAKVLALHMFAHALRIKHVIDAEREVPIMHPYMSLNKEGVKTIKPRASALNDTEISALKLSGTWKFPPPQANPN